MQELPAQGTRSVLQRRCQWSGLILFSGSNVFLCVQQKSGFIPPGNYLCSSLHISLHPPSFSPSVVNVPLFPPFSCFSFSESPSLPPFQALFLEPPKPYPILSILAFVGGLTSLWLHHWPQHPSLLIFVVVVFFFVVILQLPFAVLSFCKPALYKRSTASFKGLEGPEV